MNKILLVIIVQIIFNISSFCQENLSNKITIGTRDTIFSNILSENRPILVYLPPSYYSNKNQKYPVLYILDGDYNFQYVTGLIELQSSISENIPEMIVIGISGKGSSTYRENCKPNVKEIEDRGNAESTALFIKQELIPYIDSTYKTDNYKILSGHSIGGLFVINTLLNHPNLFNHYIAISPALWWGKNAINDIAKKTLENNSNYETSVYISLANEEGMGVESFLEVVKSNSIFRFKKIANENHNSVGEPTYKWALNDIFNDWKVEKLYFDSADELSQHYRKTKEHFGRTFNLQNGVIANTVLYILKDNSAELKKMQQEIKRFYPNSLSYFNNLLATNFINDKKFEEAEKLLNETKNSFPNSYDTFQNLAKVKIEMNELEAADSLIAKSILWAKKQNVRQWQLNELIETKEMIAKKKSN
ncbi:MAG: alpha/beta hydrolase-fold protein [Melioribacteraceae bacterium]